MVEGAARLRSSMVQQQLLLTSTRTSGSLIIIIIRLWHRGVLKEKRGVGELEGDSTLISQYTLLIKI